MCTNLLCYVGFCVKSRGYLEIIVKIKSNYCEIITAVSNKPMRAGHHKKVFDTKINQSNNKLEALRERKPPSRPCGH